MRLLIQRVKEAKVVVDQKTIGEISKGLLVFLGIHKDDTEQDIFPLLHKLVRLRIFSNEEGKMHYCVKDIEGSILVVSQFTLYANCKKGMRPSFIEAALPEKAKHLYDLFITSLRKEIKNVETGQFGAEMQVYLINDGPVTLIL